MLTLKKVQILGFKSFCDRTEVPLAGHGIAAIVGPNGCGKSNISDAITWVLGEQSAKSLRGLKMEDVIFAGTRDRKPTGMAEVSLTLVDPEVYDSHEDTPSGPELVTTHPADWDETAERERLAQDTEDAVADAQPGTTYEARVPKRRAHPLPENASPEEIAAAAEAVDEDEEERGGHLDLPEIDASGEAVVGALEETEEPDDDSADAAAAHTGAGGVVLKVRRRKFGRTPVRAGELTITRRLFRSGDSEYLLNGKLCRLRDIQDIFMGTGLGGETYAIIGQERIGQLLSSKPLDRRGIIEEAAGITRFKTKKRLAELRLESARANLARVNDIFEEVTRQLAVLKRQAAKAERYGALRDDLRGRLRIVLASRLTHMDAEAVALAADIARLETLINAQAAQLETLDAEHSAGTARGYELDAHLRELNERATRATVEIERIAGRLTSNRDRLADLADRTAAASADLAAAREQIAVLAAEREQLEAFLATATADSTAARAAAAQGQSAAQEAARKVIAAEAVVEQQRHASTQALQRAAAANNEIGQMQAALAALERETERLTAESDGARRELDSLGQQRGQAKLSFESVSERLKTLEAEIAGTRQQLEANRREEADLRQRGNQLRSERAQLTGRRDSLQALLNEHSYSTDTVKQLLKKSGAFAAHGTLADHVVVDDQYARLVDEFLRDELDFIVVADWHDAYNGLALLRTDTKGSATVLVRNNGAAAEPPALTLQGVTPLRDVVHVKPEFGSLSLGELPLHSLPRLANSYATSDRDLAQRLAAEHNAAWFIAPGGEVFFGSTVTGGTARTQGPLALGSELAKVQTRLASSDESIAENETSTAAVARDFTALSAALEARSHERRDAERESANSGAALRQMEAEAHRIESRLGQWQLAAARNRDSGGQRSEAIARKSDDATRFNAEHLAIDAKIAEIAGTLAALRTAREELAAAASQANAALAGLEERRRNADANAAQIRRLYDTQQARAGQLSAQFAQATTERERREAEIVELTAGSVALTAEREAATQPVPGLTVEAGRLRQRLAELDVQLRTLRHDHDAQRDTRGAQQARAARLSSDIEHLEATTRNDLAVEPAELRADSSVARIADAAQLAAEDEAARALRARMDAMGPVNMMALEEFEETNTRHTFLETQRADLLDSITNTQASIKEIDDVSRVKFDEAFKIINDNFANTFTKLFGGGQALMRLTDEANSAESGIEIIASPPGKKLQNVLLLSGGEKALTALSLLVGIFQFQPAPFCVLDEVDAPLDETNVGRFARLIADMSQAVQFVVITHSKRTMEQADIMYGVTMQQPGVSKIVSVSLGGRLQDGRSAA